ncbi:PREDICTED: zinc finger protein 677-like, partial [Rhagoletis zephyria]|uniref:zinc finger protein 677-like n=1 Tax=Rhagoletis zephyria TaxID=28612 RepID=UPI0008118802
PISQNPLSLIPARVHRKTKKLSRPEIVLSDEQFIDLAKRYETHPCLWNENEIAYRFTNRRREALENILQEFNLKFDINLTKPDLEKEISRLRKICSYEKNQKIECKQSKSIYKPTCRFYEHLAFAEVDVNPFECSVCGNLLPSQTQYKIHLASHDGSLPYKCIVCGHGFQESANLTVHLRRHAQDYKYTCEVCNRPIATTTELKAHMLIHTGERPYVCDVCGKSFKMLYDFKEHLLRHEERKIHKCTICPKAFYNRSMFREHKATHLKVRDKICSVCNKGFTTRKQLRQHKDIHDAEKKFVCKICGKRFAQSAGLCGHIKSHGTALSSKIANYE